MELRKVPLKKKHKVVTEHLNKAFSCLEEGFELYSPFNRDIGESPGHGVEISSLCYHLDTISYSSPLFKSRHSHFNFSLYPSTKGHEATAWTVGKGI